MNRGELGSENLGSQILGGEIVAVQTFSPDRPATTGKVPTKREALSAGDTFTFNNNGRTFIRVTAGSTETKVKVTFQQKPDGVAPAPREVTVKEATKIIGPFERSVYNSEEEKVEFTLTATTGVTVEIVELP